MGEQTYIHCLQTYIYITNNTVESPHTPDLLQNCYTNATQFKFLEGQGQVWRHVLVAEDQTKQLYSILM